ncbi:glutamate--tRNA ligase [Planctomycetota bacterium]
MAIELPETPARVRIAPSPTGDPHVGTAYVALFNKALALRTGGRFVLRIEDTDRTRYQAGAEQQIADSLRWLGLSYDEGPDLGGPFAPYRQSERTGFYRDAADALIASGKAYRCFCTPERLKAMREEQLKAKQGASGYDGRCRRLPEEEVAANVGQAIPCVIRLGTPDTGTTTFTDALRGEVSIANEQVDDQVLIKSDGFPTYHLANVVDDHNMGITHVIRAEEWISSTPKHVLLYEAFGWPVPVFVHMPLLRNNDKNKTKISKRRNPVSLIWYRQEGFLPEALVNFLGLMGYSMPDEREVFGREEFYRDFDPKRLKTTGPVFDLQKLEWLNGEWIRKLSLTEFCQRIADHLGEPYAGNPELMRQVAPLVQGRIRKLNEWPKFADMFYGELPPYDASLLTPKKIDRDRAKEILSAMVDAMSSIEPFSAEALEALGREHAQAAGIKIGPCFMVLRVATTGSKVSPPLFESMEVLGREETLARLRSARELLL